jgi:hypothetical protein
MTLINDIKALLSSNLGKFTDVNQPAIAYENSNYSRNISGILCLLPYISSTTPIKLLGGSNYHRDELVIRLINYDTTPSLKLKNCVDALQSSYDVVSQIYTDGDSEIFEQIKITILDFKLIEY